MTAWIRAAAPLVALALAGVTPASEEAGLTARRDLAQVEARARAWRADAVLVHLSTMRARPDGTAAEWKYSFASLASGKRCVVTARPGTVTVREVPLGSYRAPLGDFIDSDKAMAAARAHGLKGREPSMSVQRPAGAGPEATAWIVTGGWAAGDTSVTVDARSGAVLRRAVMGKD